MSQSKSKTIHVDFKNKKVLRIDEVEYTGGNFKKTTVLGTLDRPGIFAQSGIKATAFQELQGTDALKVDPAAYLEAVICRFEEHLNDRGCFEEAAYNDPQTYADALNTFKILHREIPMLIDTMEVLREIITLRTGTDPAPPKTKAKKV